MKWSMMKWQKVIDEDFYIFLFQHMIQNYSNMMRGGQTGANPPPPSSSLPQSSKQDSSNWKGPSWCWPSSWPSWYLSLPLFLGAALPPDTSSKVWMIWFYDKSSYDFSITNRNLKTCSRCYIIRVYEKKKSLFFTKYFCSCYFSAI